MNKQYLPVLLIGILFVALWFSTISMLVFNLQMPLISKADVQNKTPTVSITLYAGEMSNGKLGFGLSPDNLTSPGPTLRFSLSDIANVTVINSGKMPHAFAITNLPRTGSNVLFQAELGSAGEPLSPGQQGSVIFSPNAASSVFYYICPVPGHAEDGMWGSVVVTG